MDGFQARNERILGVGICGSEDDVDVYHRHNEYVRRIVPSERLLEFDPKDGWEPLCRFLDIAVPTDEAGKKLPYPHENDTEKIRRGINIFIVMGCASWIVLVGLIMLSVRLVW